MSAGGLLAFDERTDPGNRGPSRVQLIERRLLRLELLVVVGVLIPDSWRVWLWHTLGGLF